MGNVFPSVSDQIKRIKHGDKESWDFVCRMFEAGLMGKTRLLMKSLSGKRNEVIPQDVVQETLMRAWRKRESFRGENTAQFSKWLLVILRNHFIDRCGAIKRDVSIVTWNSDSPVEGMGCAETPSYHVMNQEQESRLHVALIGLEPQERRVVDMRSFEGKKFSEIAEETGININTVAGIYRRALRKLSKQMNENSHD